MENFKDKTMHFFRDPESNFQPTQQNGITVEWILSLYPQEV